MKRFFAIILAMLVTGQSAQAIDTTYPEAHKNGSTLAIIAGTGLSLYIAGKIAYKKAQLYLRKVSLEASVEAIVLAFTPNTLINKQPEAERVEAMRNKAHLIAMRKRVLEQLSDITHTQADTLSAEHVAAIQKFVKRSRKFFIVIDTLSSANPYEAEYASPSFLDRRIEKAMINSIILSEKPAKECSQKELQAQKEQAQTRDIILEKLRYRLSGIVLNKIATSSAIMHLFVQ